MKLCSKTDEIGVKTDEIGLKTDRFGLKNDDSIFKNGLNRPIPYLRIIKIQS